MTEVNADGKHDWEPPIAFDLELLRLPSAQPRLLDFPDVLQWLKWLMKITPYCKN